jgi:Thioredoxin like C-terminal domain
VVAVQFGTYSCINWIRTLPYVRAWAHAYSRDGLLVLGVQTPEFGFEHDIEGVRRAMKAMSVEHAIVLDNDYAIWRAFDNHYWPALYVVDGDGRVTYRHFGEEAYRESEDAIRALLGAGRDHVDVEATGVEAAADWDTLRSPETYVGYLRAERQAPNGTPDLALNQWALSGEWRVEEESARLEVAGGSITYRFHARDVNLVLTADADVPFTVRLDGRSPADEHGIDADEVGHGTVRESRLYQLVRQAGVVSERSIEITFEAPGVRAYVFTFG